MAVAVAAFVVGQQHFLHSMMEALHKNKCQSVKVIGVLRVSAARRTTEVGSRSFPDLPILSLYLEIPRMKQEALK